MAFIFNIIFLSLLFQYHIFVSFCLYYFFMFFAIRKLLKHVKLTVKCGLLFEKIK